MTNDTGWQQTYTSLVFRASDPKPDMISLTDISHALSLECRFNGHCAYHYSVAQHSILVTNICADLLQEETGLYQDITNENPNRDLFVLAMLHDATEGYIKDIPKPVKPLIPGYEALEAKIDAAIMAKYLPHVTGSELSLLQRVVKRADIIAVLTERNALLRSSPLVWVEDAKYKASAREIIRLTPEEAERQYINILLDLGLSID